MATEVSRTSYGSTDKGVITVIGKMSYDVNEKPVTTYEVRHGVRTIDSGLSEAKAAVMAKALGGAVATASEEVSDDDAKHRRAIAAKVLP